MAYVNATAGAARQGLGSASQITSSHIVDATVAAADLGTDAVTTAKIAAGAVTSAKLESDILQYADVQITNAQMLAIRATPITLVAAPGANRGILVDKVYMLFDVTTTGYTETTDNLVVEYGDGTDIMTVETTGFLDQTTDQKRVQAPEYVTVMAAVPVANSTIQLKNSGDGELGGGNAANTLSVRVYYHVVDTIAFS